MSFKPCFRQIVVEPVLNKVKKNKSSVLLPDDTQAETSTHTLCKVVDFAKDCQLVRTLASVAEERFVIVETHMIQKIVTPEGDLFIIPETAVVLMSYRD